jgi:hypothetical protein
VAGENGTVGWRGDLVTTRGTPTPVGSVRLAPAAVLASLAGLLRGRPEVGGQAHLGVGSFVVAYGLGRRTAWAWPAGVALGAATVVWILVQYAMLGYFFLQPVIAGLGVLLLVLLAFPSMRRHYRADVTQARLGPGRR